MVTMTVISDRGKPIRRSATEIIFYAGDYSRFLELKAQREEMEFASDRKRRSVLGWNWNGQQEDVVPEHKTESKALSSFEVN